MNSCRIDHSNDGGVLFQQSQPMMEPKSAPRIGAQANLWFLAMAGRRARTCAVQSGLVRCARIADVPASFEESHDRRAARWSEVRLSAAGRGCRRPPGRRNTLVRRLHSDPSGVSLACRDLVQGIGSGPSAQVPPGLAAIGGGGRDGGSGRRTRSDGAAHRADSANHRAVTACGQLQPDFDPRPEGRVHAAPPTSGMLPGRSRALANWGHPHGAALDVCL